MVVLLLVVIFEDEDEICFFCADRGICLCKPVYNACAHAMILWAERNLKGFK
jgi:hypothetical protein